MLANEKKCGYLAYASGLSHSHRLIWCVLSQVAKTQECECIGIDPAVHLTPAAVERIASPRILEHGQFADTSDQKQKALKGGLL